MKELNSYILEKLKIDKDTKVSQNTVDCMIEIIGVKTQFSDGKKIKELLTSWIGDYSKKLYCYVSDIDYKYKFKDMKYDTISINPVEYKLLEKAKDLANQSTIYKCKDEEETVSKITLSQNDLAVYFNSPWNAIIFEKSTI